jgi:thioredoxin 1
MVKLLKFKAGWCGPCTTLAPIINEIVSEINGIIYQEVDIDQEPMLAIQHKVRSLPTVIVEKDGKEVSRITGIQPKNFYIATIKSHL